MSDALRRALQRRDSGFTLVEVVTACVILGILSALVLGIVLQTQAQSVSNRSRIAASNLAAREIDLVRDEFHRSKTAPTQIAGAGTVVNPHPLDGQTAGQPLVVDGKPYTVTRSVHWNVTGEGQSACDGGGTPLKYPTLGVTVMVTWPNMGAVKPVVSAESLAPDKGSGVPATNAYIAVKVSDQDGQPSLGRTVRVQGGGQTVVGTTDVSGCAVATVAPASGATGTAYTAQVVDAGYVDISSTANPSKSVGYVTQGQLNNNVTFQVAAAGRVYIHLIDSNGNAVLAPPAGAKVTLDAAEYSGSGPGTQYPATGSVILIDNLWPTNYGAYYGATPPAGSFERKDLPPGGTIDLNAILELANITITDLPDGTVVQVVAGAATNCTGATTVGSVAGGTLPVSLPPGEWTFFASLPSASCSPGPDITLIPGDNGTISWQFSTLTVTGAPSGATVYAAEQSKVTSPATCPPAAPTDAIVLVTSGGVPLPAGTWYVWATNGASCAKPSAQSSVVIAPGQNYNLNWGAHSITLSITNIEQVSSGNRPHVYLSSTNVTSGAGALSCTASTVSSTNPAVTVLNVGTPTSNGGSMTTSVAEGTWYVVGNDTRSSGAWSPRCRIAGKVTVGSYTGNLSIDYTAVQSGTGYPSVGP